MMNPGLRVVGEQKAELRQYKKRAKDQTQLSQVEPIPLTIEEIKEDIPQGQGESRANRAR